LARAAIRLHRPNPGSAVTTDYTALFRFTGTLHTVTVDRSGELITDTDGEMGVW
jgi:hypothetical protein